MSGDLEASVVTESPPLPPRDQRYLEDYLPGTVYNYGYIDVTEEDVVDFGRRYDPQRLHTDKAWAEQEGPFGGLISSGWHTLGMMMRLFVDNFLSSVATIASPGLEKVRWLAPVRPGNRLSMRVTVISASRSRSKPMQGALINRVEAFNEAGQLVCDFVGASLTRARAPAQRP